MTHAPVGDFGSELNHSLNTIGNYAIDKGLSARQLDAMFSAACAAIYQLFENDRTPLSQDEPELHAKISTWLNREGHSVPDAERMLNAGVSAACNLWPELFKPTAPASSEAA